MPDKRQTGDDAMTAHTEEQAREKWCPFAKFNTNIAPERIVDGGFRCIASECMAWRWSALLTVPAKPDQKPKQVMYFEDYHTDCYTPLGFCGLA